MTDTGAEEKLPLETPPAGTKEIFGVQFGQAEHFAQMLEAEGELRGLIGPRELPRLWSRHIVNSTAICPFIGKNKEVADIGAGAGFPGVVLAIARPDVKVTLIEPMDRRCSWLEDVIDELCLDNVRLLQARAHELHGYETFDYVTSRAVASLTKLVTWSMPLLKPKGVLVALKGEKANEEIEEAEKAIKKAKAGAVTLELVERPGSDIPAHVVLVRKK